MKHARVDISDRGSEESIDNIAHVGAVKPVVEHPDHVPDHRELQRRKRNHGLIGVVIVLFLLAAIGGVGTYLVTDAQSRAETARIVEQHEAEAQAAKDQAEAAAAEEQRQAQIAAIHAVTFSVSGVDYDSYATRIPVQVVGQSAAGETIDETMFVNSSGAGVNLPAGTYKATVVASPLASTGMVYTVSSPEMEFTINEDDGAEVPSGHAVVLLPVEADQLTQDMIDAAYNWAMKDEVSAVNAPTYKQAAETAMAESKERKRKASSEARQRLAQEFVSEYFTTVMFTNQDDDSEVAVIDNWSEIVLDYVREGTALADTLAKGEKEYRAALTIEAPTSDDKKKTVTVKASVVSTDKVVEGWTLDDYDATVVCTFDDDNLITKIKVTTPKGSKEY